ncbi:MAG TPA: type II secretion system major pseudopilin GspG [Steroidobacteraceae bacterium]|nr:type II secretion system major pseudopilin GspG [Steroidobacteraceae bacterium]
MKHHRDEQQVSRGAAAPCPAPARAWRAGSLRRSHRGFTLIEIMVVVIIIGLLAAVIVPSVISKVDEARVTKAKQDIQSLETALTMFRLDNSKYPTTDQGLLALVQQPTDPSIRHWRPGGYLQRISKDPWGADYQYVFPGTHGKEYDLFTLGADGQPGGEGINADIGNWNIGDE